MADGIKIRFNPDVIPSSVVDEVVDAICLGQTEHEDDIKKLRNIAVERVEVASEEELLVVASLLVLVRNRNGTFNG